jgi:hypothetical protein
LELDCAVPRQAKGVINGVRSQRHCIHKKSLNLFY